MSALRRAAWGLGRQAVASGRWYATKRKAGPHPNSVPVDRAIAILKAYEVGMPRRTVELHVECVPEKGQPPIRGTCVLPRGFSSNVRVLVFAQGEKAKEALAAGADFVGSDDLVAQVREGKVKFDKCLATPDMLPKVASIARILGPKGLMPTINKGTVAEAIGEAVTYAKGSLDFRADKANIVHTGVAQIGFSPAEITENIRIIMDSIRANAKNNRAKFVARTYLSSTRGPGIQLADA
ncbi:hypothetical protein H4R19_000341 [Coemansia spiralis]|nr:hypothetical protein H4R19_000341 [Coemansia spiralis]